MESVFMDYKHVSEGFISFSLFFSKFEVVIIIIVINIPVKGGYYDHFWIHRSKWSFWYQMKAPIFLITPVKFYVQQIT